MSIQRPPADSLLVGALLTMLIALGQLSTAIYVPSLPSMMAALGTTQHMVTLTFTVFLAGFAVSQLVFGPLSDCCGRRVVLLAGVLLFAVASVACALAPSIEWLIAARFVQSMGACSGAVVGRAVVRDAYGPERAARAFAYIGVAFSLSPAISPIIGGFLQEWFGWRASFVFLAGAGGVALAAAIVLLDETNRFRDARALAPRAMARNFATLLKSPVYVGNTAAVALVFSGLMAFVTGSPFVFVQTMHIAPSRYGLYAALAALGTLAGSLSAGRWSVRYGTRRMIRAGIALAILGGGSMTGLGLAGVLTPMAIIGPVLVFLTGMGIVMPNGMAGAMAPFPRMAGAASALLGFVQMAAAAAASSIVGSFVFTTQLPLGLFMLGLACLALAAFALCNRAADRGKTA